MNNRLDIVEENVSKIQNTTKDTIQNQRHREKWLKKWTKHC